MGTEKEFTPKDQIQKTPEEQLGEFFDDNDGLKLKQELSLERYEEEKKKFIQEGLETEDINSMLEKRTYEARFDPVTGLKNRRELFKKTSPKIKKLFGISPNDEPSDEEWLELIKNKKTNLVNTDLYIMMSDISFLGLVNDLMGHNNGDKFLKKIATEMQNVTKECFRHGGDEISGVFEMSQEELEEMIKNAKNKIANIKNLPGLESFKLKPNIDIGIAKLGEALKIYKQLLNIEPEQTEINKNVLRNLQKIWLTIADKRTSINKAKERIPILIKRANGGQKLIGALSKAAYNINEQELQSMQDTYNNNGNIAKEINGFIKRKEIENFNKTKSSNKKLTELILKHVGIL